MSKIVRFIFFTLCTNTIFICIYLFFRRNERDDRRSRATAVLGGVPGTKRNSLYSGRKSSGMQSAAEIRKNIAQSWFNNQEMNSFASHYPRARYSTHINECSILEDDEDSLPPKPFKRVKKSRRNEGVKLKTVNLDVDDDISKLTGLGADDFVEVTTGEKVD